MNDKRSPKSWSSAFLGGCVSVFLGAIALQLALTILRDIAPLLITSGLLVVVVAALLAWGRRDQSEPW